MNSASSINIAKSSIIGLQAEVVRKEAEAKEQQSQHRYRSSKLELKPHILAQITSVKEKKVITQNVSLQSEDDSISYEKSKVALIAKSKLYDKLKKKELTIDDPDQFLVDFTNYDVDDVDNDSDQESEWITFTDSLGRSRTCLRSDVDYYRKLDSNISPDVRGKGKTASKEVLFPSEKCIEKSVPISQEMALWEKKREELRKQWEEEEKTLNEKRDIHYQDVLFDEARMHGVGFFKFSNDETERQKQQEELNKLREETAKNQMLSMTVKERREQLMKRRVAAAKRRKRERLGLPLDIVDEENNKEETDPVKQEKKDEEQESREEMAKKIEEMLKEVERSRHIRPWDVGKDGVSKPAMSQEQWNEKQRTKRKNEFAPPSSYYQLPTGQEENKGLYFTSKKKFRGLGHPDHKSVPIEAEYDIESIDLPTIPECERTGATIPPPQAYETDRIPGKLNKRNVYEAFEMGLQRQKKESEQKSNKKDRNLLDIE